MLEAGANLNVKDKSGRTPLLVLKQKHEEIVNILLSGDKEFNIIKFQYKNQQFLFETL